MLHGYALSLLEGAALTLSVAVLSLGIEERLECRVGGEQPNKGRLGHRQRQRVLNRRHVERRGAPLPQGDGPEARPLLAAVHEGPVGVMHVRGARAQDEQPGVRLASGDQPGPAPEVLDRQLPRELIEDCGRERGEGFVPLQHVTDLGQFDVQGHAIIVAARAVAR